MVVVQGIIPGVEVRQFLAIGGNGCLVLGRAGNAAIVRVNADDELSGGGRAGKPIAYVLVVDGRDAPPVKRGDRQCSVLEMLEQGTLVGRVAPVTRPGSLRPGRRLGGFGDTLLNYCAEA